MEGGTSRSTIRTLPFPEVAALFYFSLTPSGLEIRFNSFNSAVVKSLQLASASQISKRTPSNLGFASHENVRELLRRSVEAGRASYSPYSKFPVGAALLCDDDEIYLGCNVENISFGLTVCAEQTAIVKAVSEGKKQFKAIAVTADSNEIPTPCGKCRQFILEFGNEIDIYCARPDLKEVLVTSSSALLPKGFIKF